MNDRERAVNQDLQILGDAYRLGQIQREEYRARRRHVLAGLRSGSDLDTTRKPGADRDFDTVRAPVPHGASGLSAAPVAAGVDGGRPSVRTAPRGSSIAWQYWLLFGIGLVIVAVALALLLKSPDEPAPATAVSAAPAALDPLAELEASIGQFTERDDWQAAAVDTLTLRWQRLDPALRRAALRRPALQQLRDQASYNLSVRKALASPDADADGSADPTTDAIERLLRALDGPA